jgi:hypothetical protein
VATKRVGEGQQSKISLFTTPYDLLHNTQFCVQIVVPALPGKAIKRLLPFRNDDGIYDEDFIEERRKSLEAFVNK